MGKRKNKDTLESDVVNADDLERCEERIRLKRSNKKNTRPLEAKTETQGQMISQILAKDIVFVTGPAGTGKTYIAASMAADLFREEKVERIIITRPMIACGEDMGFLPGDMDEKYAPWAAPVLDVLEERLGNGFAKYLLKHKQIVLSPLQYMRGASLKDSFVICDEAQNMTPAQMKMFLTRLGHGSKMVIDGDIKQSDLVDHRGIVQLSGMEDAQHRLGRIPEIGFIEFTRDDIVRHGITKKILQAYGD